MKLKAEYDLLFFEDEDGSGDEYDDEDENGLPLIRQTESILNKIKIINDTINNKVQEEKIVSSTKNICHFGKQLKRYLEP